jgi:hypothetical protein
LTLPALLLVTSAFVGETAFGSREATIRGHGDESDARSAIHAYSRRKSQRRSDPLQTGRGGKFTTGDLSRGRQYWPTSEFALEPAGGKGCSDFSGSSPGQQFD